MACAASFRPSPAREPCTVLAALRLLLLLLLPTLSQANVLSLPATQQAVLPGPFMQVWQDPPRQAELDDVRRLPDSAWQPVGRRDASFGYSGSAYWLRLQLHKDRKSTRLNSRH